MAVILATPCIDGRLGSREKLIFKFTIQVQIRNDKDLDLHDGSRKHGKRKKCEKIEKTQDIENEVRQGMKMSSSCLGPNTWAC